MRANKIRYLLSLGCAIKNRRHPQIIAVSGTAHQSLVGIWLQHWFLHPTTGLSPRFGELALQLQERQGLEGKAEESSATKASEYGAPEEVRLRVSCAHSKYRLPRSDIPYPPSPIRLYRWYSK